MATLPDGTVDYTDNAQVADPNGRAAWLAAYAQSNPSGAAQAARMAQNAEQNVGREAAPQSREFTTVTVGKNARENETKDWRVSLSVPDELLTSNIFAPLKESAKKLIFPFNPTILLGSSANYSSIQPTHTNHPFYAYENSQIDNITITGEFIQENES